MVSDEKLTEIRERIPISTLISDYVQLKKSGKSHKGLCPFHQERTPSFYVNDERESFHCFGCGTGGDLFEFLKKIEGISFPEAIERLAERAGVEVDQLPQTDPKRQSRKKRSLELLRHTAWYYHCLLKNLPEDHEVWIYLKERQIPRQTVEEFFLGYSPSKDSGLKKYLLDKGFKISELEGFQIFKGSREFFRGRLIFPIFRADKKVVGFGGRKLNDRDHGPKYLNSPESDVFKKGDLVYGLDRAKGAIRQEGEVILAEGYFDVLSLHAHGFTYAVAPLGTALTQHQARTLHRLAENIVLAFDGDDAGQKAALRALDVLLSQGNLPRALRLESGEDPDSFLRRHGRLVLEKKLAAARNLLEELIDKWSAQAQGPKVPLGVKGQMAGQLLAFIEKIPNRITKNLYLRRLAEALEMPEDWLHRGDPFESKPQSGNNRRERPHWLPEEETILEIWLKFGELRPHICEKLQPGDFCTENVRILAASFWDLARKNPQVSTGKYFDLAPLGLIEVLSELALRSNGLEEESTAKQTLEQASLRLKEKRLRMDLQDLKRSAAPEQITLIQKKIDALSQVIKDKARTYGQG